MIRRLLQIGCILSGAIFVLTIVFWYRSYSTLDEWIMSDASGRRWEAVSYQGAIHVFRAGVVDKSWRRLRWDMQEIGADRKWEDLYTQGTLHWRGMGMYRIGSNLTPGAGAASPFTATAPAAARVGVTSTRLGFLPWLILLPYEALAISYAYPLLLSCILPAIWVMKLAQRRRRIRMGLCLNCGYDLRASAERCPECGMMIPSKG